MSRTEIVRFPITTSMTMKLFTTFHIHNINAICSIANWRTDYVKCSDFGMYSCRHFFNCDQQVTDFYIFSFKHIALLLYNITRRENKSRTKNVRFYNFVNQRGGIRETFPVTIFFTLIVQPDNSVITI